MILADGTNTCEVGISLEDSEALVWRAVHRQSGYRIDDDRIELFAPTFELMNVLKPGVRWTACPTVSSTTPNSTDTLRRFLSRSAPVAQSMLAAG